MLAAELGPLDAEQDQDAYYDKARGDGRRDVKVGGDSTKILANTTRLQTTPGSFG